MARAWYHTGMEKCHWMMCMEAHTHAQSLGWEHYEVHEPEPHILLFK